MWYDVGTIAVTNNSTTVTGTGTDFISGAQVGEALYIGDDLYEIAVINSSTELTLADPYLGSTASGVSYKIIPTQSLVADLSSGVADLIADFADVRDYAGNGKFNDGSVSSPAITFTQDQNNGLYRIGSDNWGLVAGGEKIVDVSTNGIKLDDNNKATFGTGDDLQIYHSGTHSFIRDEGAGDLYITTNGSKIDMMTNGLTEYGLRIFQDGEVGLYHDNSKKLATTSTGVDVTGTVTADGLTVDTAQGLVRINPSASDLNFTRAGTNYIRATDASGEFVFVTGANDFASRRMTLSSSGNVSFYEDTGTTAKMVWSSGSERLDLKGTQGSQLRLEARGGSGTYWEFDSLYSSTNPQLIIKNNSVTAMSIDSSGRVGIGTASPSAKIHLNGTGASDTKMQMSSGTGLASIDGRYGNLIISADENNAVNGSVMAFRMDNSEAMRIDNSRNLLVGTTTDQTGSASGTGGTFIGSYLGLARNGGVVQYSNRIGTDGDISVFRKNGATVGSIGSIAGQYLYVGTGDTGLAFDDDTDTLVPWNPSTNANRSNSIDLGSSTQRFKDLYLSGGVITSSDYRLKEDIQPMQSYADTVKQMNLVNFAWKESGEREDGFIAHELQALVPNAVRGNKDAVNEDGEAQYQGVDPLKLIPVLTKALQEALERIEALEAKL